ncbi:hypothetical protein TUN199_09957 [Pyrenophora tritici-repentis]|nr:hypothetical protein Alg215_01836 [Pyrenophora tritici-repentis]KAI0618048.1 hypothetical protein TUN199_09957 [Pyrenophora tritici-repentis]
MLRRRHRRCSTGVYIIGSSYVRTMPKSLHKLTGVSFLPTVSVFFSSSTLTGGTGILLMNTGKAIDADERRNTDDTLLDALFRVLVQDVDRDLRGFFGEGDDDAEKED